MFFSSIYSNRFLAGKISAENDPQISFQADRGVGQSLRFRAPTGTFPVEGREQKTREKFIRFGPKIEADDDGGGVFSLGPKGKFY